MFGTTTAFVWQPAVGAESQFRLLSLWMTHVLLVSCTVARQPTVSAVRGTMDGRGHDHE